ncbi:MAG TPA: tetratricopeptide repeat protein [Ideonella sp.]|uniref:tetratricopeptide repeat protein n=1 Tax=Ideonella sp. TaxID=1929293 RepID=UPI002E3380B2|nr:tetratricopeptide repeat protein [Ideonella sp.]HEX5687083.1 tetratricopeptide repeat protein [Ideonella sp.]
MRTPEMRHPLFRLTLLAAALSLSACANKGRNAYADDAPTLKTLAGREYKVEPDTGIAGDEEQAIEAYNRFLAAAPNAPQRPQAMRRLGDLAMDAADSRFAASTAGAADPDYKAAIQRYQDYLKAYPNDPDNDRVYYQLSRAYEQGGQLEVALKTLDQLVKQYPNTRYLDEAQFRRGELLFTARNYTAAEQAYAIVLKTEGSLYRDRALYMHGWSVFKQGRLEEALTSFFGVLDLKLGPLESDDELEKIDALTRADRELVEDTFRVTSLSLENLKGAESIPTYIDSDVRRTYEFRVYQQLSALYLKQDRPKDAADALNVFARRQPLHAQAPLMQARVIEIQQQSGFDLLALESKKEYVARYGVGSEFRKANPEGWERAQPLVKTHLTELATRYHAAAQKTHATADVQEAVRWYRDLIDGFPDDAAAPRNHFLLAELLFEDKQFAAAAAEYEISAYKYPTHPQSADAGYAALLAYAEQDKRARAEGNTAVLTALQKTSVESALRFAQANPSDSRAAPVLTNAADKLYTLGEGARAATVAQQVLALQPPAAPALRKVAWTVVAHTSFETGAYDQAEKAYTEVLALTPEKDATRTELTERLAAAIYKQGEAARTAGQTKDAAGHFARVAVAAPNSTVRTAAQYDAAAAQIAMKDWAGATRTLEDFRQRFPKHQLADEVTTKLALAYTEQGQWAPAAAEYERLAAVQKDPELARSAQWQAAEMYDKAAQGGTVSARSASAKAYERYLRLYPAPLEQAVEARYRLVKLAEADGNASRALALQKEIFQADQAGGSARTGRTKTLGAMAALAIAEPVRASYAQVQLVEPLQKQLKLKKTKLEETLKVYTVAADYGVAEVVTASTYQIGALYQDFGKALIGSQRPKKLSKIELEQYNVLLEEQAFPFEEKAIELHEVNAKRSADGLYDEWVKKSFAALRELRPGRWGKSERADNGASKAAQLNSQAIALRQQGQFDKARETYEAAIAADANYAPASLNLGVLHDLYLNHPDQALELYNRYLALTPAGDAAVGKWVADVKTRAKPAPAPTAAASAPAATPAASAPKDKP